METAILQTIRLNFPAKFHGISIAQLISAKTKRRKGPVSKMNRRVLITGASSGIGLALAREFAKNGHSLVIVSPVEAEIEDVAARIRQTSGVEVTALAADLTQETAPEEIFRKIHDEELEVHTLVNNAGLGHRGLFSEIPLDQEIDILRLNVEAVVRMTKVFLNPMLERNSGKICNTA